MSECRTVLTDMDGVLADFDGEVIKRMKERYPNIPILDSRKNIYISDDYPEYSLLIREIADEQGFFESLPFIENAIKGWERIIKLGYEPRICSAPMISNPYTKSEKLIWLRERFVPIFGRQAVEQAIIAKEKHLYDGIAMIDDMPEMTHANEASWTHIIFDQPYNQHGTGPRLKGWLDDNLPSLLEDTMNSYHKNR